MEYFKVQLEWRKSSVTENVDSVGLQQNGANVGCRNPMDTDVGGLLCLANLEGGICPPVEVF